jgi:hypothetical protein
MDTEEGRRDQHEDLGGQGRSGQTNPEQEYREPSRDDDEREEGQHEEDQRGEEEEGADDKPAAPAGRKLDVHRVECEENKAEFLEACSSLDMNAIRGLVEDLDVNPGLAFDSVGQNCLHFLASSMSETAVKTRSAVALRAETQRQTKLIGYLRSRGADPNCKRATDGWTPLHVAALLGRKDLVRALLAAGASATVTDHDGMTAEDWARRYRMEEIRNILLHRYEVTFIFLYSYFRPRFTLRESLPSQSFPCAAFAVFLRATRSPFDAAGGRRPRRSRRRKQQVGDKAGGTLQLHHCQCDERGRDRD